MRRDIFQAVADPTRRAIIALIALQPLTPNAIADNFNTTRQAVSKHLRILTECELVKLKGTRPTDVLVGESGKGQREVQVLYSEPGGREIYLFTDNRLTRIVKPGQG